MATKKVKKENKAKIPKFFTTDIKGKCVIYELHDCLNDGYNTTCIYHAKKNVHYTGRETVVEDTTTETRPSVIIELNNKDVRFPTEYNDMELCWFDSVDSIEEVIAISTI